MNSITTVGNAFGACRIEGMLHALALRKNELVKNQSKIEGKVTELMQELQNSIIRDNDLTVINSSFSVARQLSSEFYVVYAVLFCPSSRGGNHSEVW